jgi:hypothetical protein
MTWINKFKSTVEKLQILKSNMFAGRLIVCLKDCAQEERHQMGRWLFNGPALQNLRAKQLLTNLFIYALLNPHWRCNLFIFVTFAYVSVQDAADRILSV